MSPPRKRGPISRTRRKSYGEMAGYVYIIANRKNGTLYTGVTNDIARRIVEHREKTGSQ